MDFQEIYEIVDLSSGAMAFDITESMGYYNILARLPDLAVIVEIGIQFGRSLTLSSLVGKEKHFDITAIDSWKEDCSPDARAHVAQTKQTYNLQYEMITGRSDEVVRQYNKQIDALLVDGSHTYDGVYRDCELWIPKVKENGYILFHDYNRTSLPGIRKAVDQYVHANKNLILWHVYNSLAIFKKQEEQV